MNNRTTYLTTLNWQDAASSFRTGQFNLVRSVNIFLIKKVVINNSYLIPALPIPYPVAEDALNDVGIEYILSDAGNLTTNVFTFGALPIGVARLDNHLVFSRSGIWDFTGGFCSNNLQITYNFRNASLINPINLLSTILIEIEVL